MHNYIKLRVWQESVDLAKEIYVLTRDFPKEETYGLTSQIRRASVSIPSNIAEGSSRNSDKAFSYFVEISLGSAFELQTQLIIAKKLSFLGVEKYEKTEHKLIAIIKQLQSLKKRLSSGS